MNRVPRGLALAAVAVVAAETAVAQVVDHGAQLYARHCATCHGADGKGDGPMTRMMTVPVPDLTRLGAESGGAFPMLQVIHIIDGRNGLLSHGGPMPVFGAVFAEESSAGSSLTEVLESRGRILSIAYYLESIQE